MSKQRQLAVDAVLRQGPLDLGADVSTLRAGSNDVMARVPVADDVDQKPTTIGGGAGPPTQHLADQPVSMRPRHSPEPTTPGDDTCTARPHPPRL
jgi:hypothetical protein